MADIDQLQDSHNQLVQRFDRFIEKLRGHGIHLETNPKAAAENRNATLAANAGSAPVGGVGSAQQGGDTQFVPGSAAPAGKLLADATEEELWDEVDRRISAKSIHGSPMASESPYNTGVGATVEADQPTDPLPGEVETVNAEQEQLQGTEAQGEHNQQQ